MKTRVENNDNKNVSRIINKYEYELNFGDKIFVKMEQCKLQDKLMKIKTNRNRNRNS